jgi:molybdate transport system substrate-binding protein
MRKISWIIILLLLSTLSCSNSNTKEKKIIIAAASSTKFAMQEIIELFESNYNIKCDLVTGSSGKLAMQIINNAPFDIFISANEEFAKKVCSTNKCLKKPVVFASGSLVIYSKNNDFQLDSLLLFSDSISHIAIANPETAPYGKATLVFFKNKKWYDNLKHKFVFVENVNQVNQYVNTGVAEIGFTSLSSVINLKKGSFIMCNKNNYPLIKHSMVLINSRNKNLSKKFYNFMLSNSVKTILTKYGYS